MVGNYGRSSMLVGLFVGAAAGSIAAMLLAPAVGKQSRELVKQRTGKMAGAVKNRLKKTPVVAIDESDS